MLEDFAKVLAEVFPSVEPETARRFIQAAHDKKPIPLELYSPALLSGICQADVLGPLEFHVLNGDGKWSRTSGFGLVLSQSCDTEHDDSVIVSHGYPLKELEKSEGERPPPSFIADIVRNLLYNLFYLPAVPGGTDLVFDLSIVSTFSITYLNEAIERGVVKRFASLSLLGYYLFVSKITVHLLRPETGVDRPRSVKAGFLDRLVQAYKIMRG